MTHAEPLSSMMNDVARELLGVPNKRMSHERDGLLRFGAKGSIEVNTSEGWFADYEANVRGGVLDLIGHKAGIRDHAAAFRWLEEHGIKEASNDTANDPGTATSPIFYEYADETGEILFLVERKLRNGSKTFLQHGPDGAGGFVCRKGCMQGVRRVLYRLPELIASDHAEIVFVCEGEKDADRLAKVGLIATTNPGGAGKFLAEFAAMLAGRRVVVLQDNDSAGKEHAADVLNKLEGAAAEIAVMRLPGGDKSDVSDWLDMGGSAFDLQKLAERALEKAGPDLLPSLDLVALASQRPVAKEFAIERIAPMGEVTLFTGPGSAGKSLLAQQLCTVAAAAIGYCLGLSMIGAPALYATCEDDPAELHWRQSHICEAIGVPMAGLAGKLHLVSLRGELDNALGVEDDKGNYAPSPTYQRLVATIKATGTKLAVLDNVAHLFTGNENDRGEVTRFVNLLNRLARDTGAAILLVGHPPKATNPMAVTHDYSGSTAWLNAVRSQFKIDTPRDADGSVLDRDARVLTVGKANYAPKGDAINFRWHNWAFVRDEDLPRDVGKEMNATIRMNGDIAVFLKCLAERNRQRRQVSEKPTAQNYAPKVFDAMPESKSVGRKRLEVAMDALFRSDRIERGHLWRDSTEGKDITGLRLVSDREPESHAEVPETSPETSRKHVPETSGNPQETTGNTPPIYKYMGAATEAAAPNDDDLDWSADVDEDS